MQPSKPHDWVKPPAGQGARSDMVCAECGVRRSVAGASQCDGKHPEIVAETIHDYDPLA